MAELDTSYRTPRHRPGMDPNTRKLAMIAGGIGAALLVVVGAWSFTGGKPGGVPVVEADSRPLRVKPDTAQQGPDIDEPAPGKQALAPRPEAPRPEVLRAAAEKAAAEKLAAEQAEANRHAEQLAAAERAAEAARIAAAPPANVAPAPPQAAAAPPPPPAARPPAQPVVLSTPVAPPAPRAAPTPAARPAQQPAARPAPAVSSRTQVQLAAVGSEQAALSEWQRLARRMPDVLGGHRPAVVRTERDGKTYWRLRTGGFADTGQASSFCDKVRAKGGTCTVASF